MRLLSPKELIEKACIERQCGNFRCSIGWTAARCLVNVCEFRPKKPDEKLIVSPSEVGE